MKKILLAALVLTVSITVAGCKKKKTPDPKPDPVTLLQTWKAVDIEKDDDGVSNHVLDYFENQVIRFNPTGTYRGLEGLGAYYHDKDNASLLLIEVGQTGTWFDVAELKAQSLVISCEKGKVTFAKHIDDYFTHDDSEDFSNATDPDKDVLNTSWIIVSEERSVEASTQEMKDNMIKNVGDILTPFRDQVFSFRGNDVFYASGSKGSVEYTQTYPEFTLEQTYEVPGVVFVIEKLDKDELVFSFDLFKALGQAFVDENFPGLTKAKITATCKRYLSYDFWERFYDINNIH